MSDLRSLIIDDDFVCRSKMSAILSHFGDVVQAENGSSALSRFVGALKASLPFHFVTLDIDMPDIRGSEVLNELRELERSYGVEEQARAKIVMVTSSSDRNEVITAIRAGCNDYLLKPFSGSSIKEKLGQLGLLAEVVDSDVKSGVEPPRLTPQQALKISIERLKKGELELPRQSDTYQSLKQLMRGGADIGQIAELLKTDIVVTAKLIKLANSSYYRGLRPCKSLTDAINRLGLRVTEQQVNALCMKPVFSVDSEQGQQAAKACWQEAICTAYSCEQVAKAMNMPFALDPFTMGMVHNTGRMMILRLFDELAQQQPISSEELQALEQTFEDYQGIFAAAVLKSWGFPVGYQQLVRQQQGLAYIERGLAASSELHLLYIAKRICRGVVDDKMTELTDALASLPFAQQHGLTRDVIGRLADNLASSLPELRQVYNGEA